MGALKDYCQLLYGDIPFVVYETLLVICCIGTIVILILYGVWQVWRKVAGLLLAEYLFVICCSTIICRISRAEAEYNFMPFWSYAAIYQGKDELIAENIMNIVVFVPVGVLMGLMFRGIRWWQVLIVGSVLSISIETLQFFLKRGFSEIDDVMNNALGCMIGYGIYMMVASARKVISSKGRSCA